MKHFLQGNYTQAAGSTTMCFIRIQRCRLDLHVVKPLEHNKSKTEKTTNLWQPSDREQMAGSSHYICKAIAAPVTVLVTLILSLICCRQRSLLPTRYLLHVFRIKPVAATHSFLGPPRQPDPLFVSKIVPPVNVNISFTRSPLSPLPNVKR